MLTAGQNFDRDTVDLLKRVFGGERGDASGRSANLRDQGALSFRDPIRSQRGGAKP